MNKNKKIFIGIGYFLVSICMITLFATRTSPLYSLLMGEYGGNNASAAMVIGKYWAEGSAVPYRDLFAMKGPLYFAIQAVGWALGERTGIFVLEILSMFLFLIVMHQILIKMVPDGCAVLWNGIVLLVYVALCAGGDSAGEWCLPFLALGCYLLLDEKEWTGRKNFLLGIVTGGVLLCDFRYGALLYGGLLGRCIYSFREEGVTKTLKDMLTWLAGVLLPVGIAVIYFAIHGCLDAFWQGAFYFPFCWLLDAGTEGLKVWVHKAVKCCLLLPVIFAGLYQWYQKKERAGMVLFCAGIIGVIFLMGGDNRWYYYMAAIPAIPIGMAAILSEVEGKKKKMLTGAAGILLVVGICIVPFKNYVGALTDGVADVMSDFYEELLIFQETAEKNGKDTAWYFVESDSMYYLLTDTKPTERYFTEQLELSEYSEEIAEEMEVLMDGGSGADVLFITEHGFIGRDFDNYTLMEVYFMPNTENLFVYLPNELLFEEE